MEKIEDFWFMTNKWDRLDPFWKNFSNFLIVNQNHNTSCKYSNFKTINSRNIFSIYKKNGITLTIRGKGATPLLVIKGLRNKKNCALDWEGVWAMLLVSYKCVYNWFSSEKMTVWWFGNCCANWLSHPFNTLFKDLLWFFFFSC